MLKHIETTHGRCDGEAAPRNGERPDRWSTEAKFLIVLETPRLARGDSPEPGVELGHHLLNLPCTGDVLLPLHDRGHLQPLHRRLGDSRELEGSREWTHCFVHWCNEIHRHSPLKYVTPGQRHRGESAAILEARKEVFEEAKGKHPERWKGRSVRNLEEKQRVWLNPEKDGRTRETLTPEKRQVG